MFSVCGSPPTSQPAHSVQLSDPGLDMTLPPTVQFSYHSVITTGENSRRCSPIYDSNFHQLGPTGPSWS